MSVCMYSCVSYPACKSHVLMRFMILSHVACLDVPYFSTFPTNGTIFEKKILNTKFFRFCL